MDGWVWAVIFLILGVVASIFGFSGIAGTSTWLWQILFFVFVIGFVLTFIWGRRRGAGA